MVDVPPRSVLGYEQVMPPVPAHQPALLPGPTAGRSARVLAVRTAVGVVVVLLALQVLPVLLVSPASIGGGYLVLRAWGRVGDRCLEELRAGYTTLTIDVGDFWYGGDTRWFHHGAPWDYRGAWVLDSRGALRSPPRDPSVDRPGVYPSVSRPGQLEVWTGAVWTGHFRGRSPWSV